MVADEFSIADSDIVHIVVGEERKHHYWHQDLIKKESPLVASRLEQWYKDNAEAEHIPTIELQEGQLDCFQIITEWLYNKSSVHDRLSQLDRNFAVSIYETAEALELERLQNDVVDFMRISGKYFGLTMDATILGLLRFEQNSPNSPIWEYLVDVLAHKINHSPGRYSSYAKADPDPVAKLFASPKLAQQLMLSLCNLRSYGPRRRRLFVESMKDIDYMYHEHGNGSACSVVKPLFSDSD